MLISIIIPFHNEEKILKKTIGLVRDAVGKDDYRYEIIAVDDNSNDNTGVILDNLAKNYSKSKHVVLRAVHKKNENIGPSGLGAALRLGFKHARGDALITFMGDLSDNPSDIPKLIKKFDEGYDIVCGSRFVPGGDVNDYPKIKMISNRLWNRIFGILFMTNLKDISNGFKLYRREVIDAAKPISKGFEITAEIVLKGLINNFKIIEVPVSWHNRKRGYGVSKFGSFSIAFVIMKLPKIGWSYGKLAVRLWLEFLNKRIFGV